MKAMQRGKGGRCNGPVAAGPVAALALAAFAVALLGACSTTIRTPLPDIKPASSTALTQEERKKAVEELNKKRATHEQDAEQQIEQSR
jgi:hypothetical protein